MKENRRTVLLAKVRSLPIDLSRVVHGPERIQEFLVTQFLGVESYLHYFRMSGGVRADILVRWVVGFSPAIAHDRVDHSGNAAKRRFNSPKTSGTKRRYLLHLLSSLHFSLSS